jgi:hypothetical protein
MWHCASVLRGHKIDHSGWRVDRARPRRAAGPPALSRRQSKDSRRESPSAPPPLSQRGDLVEDKPWHPWFDPANPVAPLGYATSYRAGAAASDSDATFAFVTVKLSGQCHALFLRACPVDDATLTVR